MKRNLCFLCFQNRFEFKFARQFSITSQQIFLIEQINQSEIISCFHRSKKLEREMAKKALEMNKKEEKKKRRKKI